MILCSPGKGRGKNTTWGVRENGVQIAGNTAQQVREGGTPRRLAVPEGTGVSDHCPVLMYLESK